MELKNKRLKITFAEAGELTTPRFDHTGFITHVLLDDKYQFCMPEQFIEGRRNSNGRGLCGEFVIATGELAKEGEWFQKPGVGLIKQTADFQKFNIFGTYEAQFAPVEIFKKRKTTVGFFQKGIPCNGYCVDIKKTFHLQNNQLILEIEAINTGSKELELSEYQHNFLSLDNLPVGPGYILELPCDENVAQLENATLRWGDEFPMPSIVSVKGSTVSWTAIADNRVLYHESYNIKNKAPYHWRLSHKQSSLSVKEEVSFFPSMLIVWSVEHCICAEFYHTVKLMPGECTHWTRTWTFKK